tara:strand:- start:71 stop:625 length:555 start_codon:yes stop_codon:yes gene_type:complete
MWNKLRAWIKERLKHKVSVEDLNKLADIQAIRLMELDSTQNAKYLEIKTKLDKLEMLLQDCTNLTKVQSDLHQETIRNEVRQEFEKRYLTMLEQKRNINIDSRPSVTIEKKPKEEQIVVNPKIKSKEEWIKMRKGDRREHLEELSELDRLEQLDTVNPFLGGSSAKRGKDWVQQQLSVNSGSYM